MKKSKKKKKIYFKKWARIALIFLLSFTAVFAILLIVNGVFPKDNSTPLYTYNMERKVDYKVYLHKNSFYEEEYIGMGKQYTTELIDYVDIDFDYVYTGSKLSDIVYDYDIKAEIIGEYESTKDENKELWTKKYTLLENKPKEANNTTTFNIKENLKIDYSKYNEIVNQFKKEFKLAIDAYLKIRLNINYSGKIEGYEELVRGDDFLEIYIPLSKSTINIDTNYDENNSKTIIPTLSNDKNKESLYFGIILLISDIVLVILTYDKIFVNKKTMYLKKLERLLKDYSEIIVESSTMLNYDELDVLEIKNFDDMVDLEEELKSPIILYEYIKDKESWFIVLKGNYAYRYILSADDFE